MNGKELFSKHPIVLGDGNTYTIEFTFQSLLELEEIKNNDFQAIFKMFEGDFSGSNMVYSLWACLLTHHPDFYCPHEQIKMKVAPLIDAESFLAVKLALVTSFASFWMKAKDSKKLPPEYQKTLDEMFEKQNKTTKKKKISTGTSGMGSRTN